MSEKLRAHDKNGYPIYPGDVLRTYHFRGRRRKKYYLYHVAAVQDGHLVALPASSLGKDTEGGNFWLLASTSVPVEIVQGYGPDDAMIFDERPKVARPTPTHPHRES